MFSYQLVFPAGVRKSNQNELFNVAVTGKESFVGRKTVNTVPKQSYRTSVACISVISFFLLCSLRFSFHSFAYLQKSIMWSSWPPCLALTLYCIWGCDVDSLLFITTAHHRDARSFSTNYSPICLSVEEAAENVITHTPNVNVPVLVLSPTATSLITHRKQANIYPKVFTLVEMLFTWPCMHTYFAGCSLFQTTSRLWLKCWERNSYSESYLITVRCIPVPFSIQ